MSDRNLCRLSLSAIAVASIVAAAAIGGATESPTEQPQQADQTAAAPPSPVAPTEPAPPTEQAAPAETVAAPTAQSNGATDVDEEEGVLPAEMQTHMDQGGLHLPPDAIRSHTPSVGKVVGHPTGKVLLGVHDLITLKLNKSLPAKPHDRFGIARREQFVEHPDSGRNMGYVVRVVATVELEQAFGRYWSAEIVSSTDYVSPDDSVIPFESAVEPSNQEAADLTGHIVAVRDELVLAAQANVVYTDLGSTQGVKPGEEFAIIRPGIGGRHGSPDRPVGMLRILAVQADSSSAYLAETTEPIMIGDRLEHAVVSSPVQ